MSMAWSAMRENESEGSSERMKNDPAQALTESLLTAPLLCRQVEGILTFDRARLTTNTWRGAGTTLNFQQKLGHLYEDCLQQLLEAAPKIELLASHLQIFDNDRRTLGELDYLLRDLGSGTHIHLELAVKFYLAVEGENGWLYPGPDPHDDWTRKYNRLATHQLTLCQRDEARALLNLRFQIESVQAQHLIYGVMFRPLDAPDAPLPDTIHPKCRTGSWLHCKDWSQYFSDLERVALIPKAIWPVNFTRADHPLLQRISAEALQAQARERAVLFQNPRDLRPCFLVPDTWPRI